MGNADVIIAGGGLNGLAAALALGGRGSRIPLEVLVLEAADPAAFADPARDARASAVTESARRMLEALGVWPALAAHAQPMRAIVVTDSKLGAEARPALLRFGQAESDGRSLAFMVENHRLYAALHEAVVAAGISIRAKTAVQSYRFEPAYAEAVIEGDEILRAPLLVAADGGRSKAREAAGIGTIGWSYPQSGIVVTVEHERPHEGRAEEHFLPAGPFAILPLTGSRSSLVWTEETAEAARIMALDEAGFRGELARRFGEHLGRIEPIGPRQSFPLSLHVARSFVGTRVALLGDAAHMVHPIAGLGFNLGLRDAAALAEEVAEAVRLGLDHGAPDVLARYQAWRRLDTFLVALATDGLNRLFSNDSTALRVLRDAGLQATDRLQPLKSAFMREAAGLSGRLPRLLTGEPA